MEESTGDVYVADIGTDTVYKFDANGNPLDFAALGSNALTGSATGRVVLVPLGVRQSRGDRGR